MSLAVSVVILAGVVIVIASLCNRFGLPAPLVLTLVGVGASFLPFVSIELNPELVLVGLLPPLLYAAAIQVSLIDFRAEIKPIGLLAVGLVLFTAAGVGLVVWWILPIGLAAALALGAIVGPPDAVAATAIGRRIGVPRRVVTMLEGESLVNDATALVLLRTASAAIVGSVTFTQVVGGFAVSAIGGAFFGIAIGLLVGQVHQRFADPLASTALSLITPWLAYLPAEAVGASGVLATVVAGLIIAHRAPIQQSAMARLSQRINWTTIQFFLENTVFLLIGLQVQNIVADAGGSSLGWARIVGVCFAALGMTMFCRLLWMVLTRPLMARAGASGGRLSWAEQGVLGWAGMRGVVTLAAAFVLPAETPHRSTLVLAALAVTGGTLLIQGSTLPLVARWLRVEGPDARTDALQTAQIVRTATAAGLAHLDEVANGPDAPDEDVIEELRRRSVRRVSNSWEMLRAHDEGSTPGESYRRIRLEMLRVERDEVLRIRSKGITDAEVLANVMGYLDLEESMLDRFEQTSNAISDSPVRTPAAVTELCEHLSEAGERADAEPLSRTCLECERQQLFPVHLRICVTCGHVGCCDSAVGKHATAHYRESGHPVMRSFEADEEWLWCYEDNTLA